MQRREGHCNEMETRENVLYRILSDEAAVNFGKKSKPKAEGIESGYRLLNLPHPDPNDLDTSPLPRLHRLVSIMLLSYVHTITNVAVTLAPARKNRPKAIRGTDGKSMAWQEYESRGVNPGELASLIEVERRRKSLKRDTNSQVTGFGKKGRTNARLIKFVFVESRGCKAESATQKNLTHRRSINQHPSSRTRSTLTVLHPGSPDFLTWIYGDR